MYPNVNLYVGVCVHLRVRACIQWNGGCMVDRLSGGASGKSTKGNVFCAHRARVPAVTLLLDALSFPMMIRDAQRVRPVVPQAGAADDHKAADLDYQVLAKAYVNIKPFCEKWPACVGV
jgi:hypothetical protein